MQKFTFSHTAGSAFAKHCDNGIDDRSEEATISTAKDPPRIALFDGLADEAVCELLRGAQARQVKANAALFREGITAQAAHVLTSGIAKLVKTAPDGACVILRYIKPGEAFGTQALLHGGIYSADAIAVTDCIELQWSACAIESLLLRHPRAALNLIHELQARLRYKESRLMDLSNEPVEQRIAHALVLLVVKFGERKSEGIEVPFPVSCQDVADLTGTTLHTVSRTLGAWEAQGRLRRGRQRLTVTDVGRLTVLTGRGGAMEPQPRRTHRRAAPKR
jgi:CRP/FNR family transcriptional regulator, nitrogen oxide reductase regulator